MNFKKIKLKRNDQVGLTFFLAFVISTTLIYHFEDRFDDQLWRNAPSKRHEMVDDLIESRLLIGKSRTEALELLGEPTERMTNGKDALIYNIGNPPSFFKNKNTVLLVIFNYENVSKVTLASD